MLKFFTALTSVLTLSTISISSITEVFSNSALRVEENNKNNYDYFYLQTIDESEYDLIWIDTVEIELPKIFNLFKKLTQVVKENNKKIHISYTSAYFLTDDLKVMYPGQLSLDVAANIESLANSNYVELKGVKLEVAVRAKQFFRVFLHYKIADLEQKLELFNFDLDDLLLQQKLFASCFSVTYEI